MYMEDSYRIWKPAVFLTVLLLEMEVHATRVISLWGASKPSSAKGRCFHVFPQFSPFIVAGANIAPSRGPFAVLVVIDAAPQQCPP